MLEGLDGVVCLVDDLFIFGSTQEEHDARLTAVLQRLEEAGATLNTAKCEFHKPSVKFLGHIVSKEGIPEKTSAIAEIKLELAKSTVLQLYNPQAETKVSADASSFGVGAVLLQSKGQEWKSVAYTSRTLSETEKRYAQIEKEALATTWLVQSLAHMFSDDLSR